MRSKLAALVRSIAGLTAIARAEPAWELGQNIMEVDHFFSLSLDTLTRSFEVSNAFMILTRARAFLKSQIVMSALTLY